MAYLKLFDFEHHFAGAFEEKEFGKRFEFIEAEKGSWGELNGFKYKIAVGELGEYRYANIKKTVAYVCVDEQDGKPVTEKWFLKRCFIKEVA